MNTFTILFEFRKKNHVAIVGISPSCSDFTIYFTDVELILEFGAKIIMNQKGSIQLLKKTSIDIHLLSAALIKQLDKIKLAA